MKNLFLRRFTLTAVAALVFAALPAIAHDNTSTQAIPRPDGKPADITKPVKVYILMGQSNMLEMGKVAGDTDGALEHAIKSKGLYPCRSPNRKCSGDEFARRIRGSVT